MQLTLSEIITNHIQESLAQMYTSMPAKVVKVRVKNGTTVVDVQPMINMRHGDGSVNQEPPLGGVIVKWPSAGGCYITCPIEIGDTVDLNFSMRSIIEHKNSSGVEPQTPSAKGLHDMNDAYATPCATVYEKGTEVDPEALVIASEAIQIRVTKAGVIELGKGATEALIKGNEFITAFLAHTHTYVDTIVATATPKLTGPVGKVLSVPDLDVAWEPNLSEVSFTK